MPHVPSQSVLAHFIHTKTKPAYFVNPDASLMSRRTTTFCYHKCSTHRFALGRLTPQRTPAHKSNTKIHLERYTA